MHHWLCAIACVLLASRAGGRGVSGNVEIARRGLLIEIQGMSLGGVDKKGCVLSLDIPDRFIVGQCFVHRSNAGSLPSRPEHREKFPGLILPIVKVLPEQPIKVFVHVHDALAVTIASGKCRQLTYAYHIDVTELPFTP